MSRKKCSGVIVLASGLVCFSGGHCLVTGPGQDARPNKNRYRGWSGHSTRVGAAVDMAAKKYSTAQIMQEGTWKKPETVMRYIRHVDAHSGAMVDFMDSYSNSDDA